MELKLFSFTKTEKSPKIIEDRINIFLEDNKCFKFVAQSESTKSGKFFLSLYYENKKSNIRAKVFKNANNRGLEQDINEFLKEGHTMKWASQSSSTSSIYVVVFYELRKANDRSKKEENQD